MWYTISSEASASLPRHALGLSLSSGSSPSSMRRCRYCSRDSLQRRQQRAGRVGGRHCRCAGGRVCTASTLCVCCCAAGCIQSGWQCTSLCAARQGGGAAAAHLNTVDNRSCSSCTSSATVVNRSSCSQTPPGSAPCWRKQLIRPPASRRPPHVESRQPIGWAACHLLEELKGSLAEHGSAALGAGEDKPVLVTPRWSRRHGWAGSQANTGSSERSDPAASWNSDRARAPSLHFSFQLGMRRVRRLRSSPFHFTMQGRIACPKIGVQLCARHCKHWCPPSTGREVVQAPLLAQPVPTRLQRL